MTIRNRKPLIALIVAAGSVLAIPAMAQTAKQSAAQAQQQAAQAEQAAAQAGDAADSAAGAAAQASAQASGGGGGQTWASVDTDGNGNISKPEAQVNAGLTQVFDQADTNKDGQLTPDEYKSYVAAQQGAASGSGAQPGK